MSPAEAAKLLDVPADASPEQLEARFHELRTKLEEKIGKAPTPGLKAKYRETLTEITTAFETLTLAADSSSLPVTSKQGAGSKEQGVQNAGSPLAGGPASNDSGLRSQVSGLPPAKRAKSGGKEFAIVAVIAVALLGAGGWFVMKTRAENAEKARLAAEAQAAQEQQAAAAAAEKERQAAAESAERDRLAKLAREEAETKRLADEAERTRLDKAAAQVQSQLVQLRLSWEALEEDHRKAERRLSELRSDERSLASAAKSGETPELRKLRLLLAAQGEFVEWFGAKLNRHPAKLLRAQAEALLSARQVDEAARTATQALEEQNRADREVTEARQTMLATGGPVQLQLSPDTVQWALTDSLGEVRRGAGPATLAGIPFGAVRVELIQDGYNPRTLEGTLRRGDPLVLTQTFAAHPITLHSEPTGAEVRTGGRTLGITPLKVDWPGEGAVPLEFHLDGHEPTQRTIRVPEHTDGNALVTQLRPMARGLVRPDLSYSPRRFRVIMNWSYTGRSSDTPATNSTGNHEDLYEAAVNEGTGDWREVVATVKSAHHSGVPSPAVGTTARWERHPKINRWVSLKDGNLQNVFTADHGYFGAPSAPVLAMDAEACWPSEELTAVGQTWQIPVKEIAFWFPYRFEGSPPAAQARVTALRLSDERREADFEISWKHVYNEHKKSVNVTSTGDAMVKVTGTLDLRRHYISKVEVENRYDYTVTVHGLFGTGSKHHTSSRSRYTVQPID